MLVDGSQHNLRSKILVISCGLFQLQAYAAGYLEGFATAEILYASWVNTVQGYCDGKMAVVCEKLTAYLTENDLWVKSKIAHHCRNKNGKCSPYWHQVSRPILN